MPSSCRAISESFALCKFISLCINRRKTQAEGLHPSLHSVVIQWEYELACVAGIQRGETGETQVCEAQDDQVPKHAQSSHAQFDTFPPLPWPMQARNELACTSAR